MIDSRPLRHLIAVASHPTVQAAAESLHLTQPALTKSISRFEEALGAKLFDRRGHRLELTELGERLVARGESIMRHLHSLEEEVSLWKNIGTGEIEIGVDPEAELSLLPRVLKSFVPQHPGVQVKIRSGDTRTLLPALLAGEIHFMVADAELAHSRQDLDIDFLCNAELFPAVRPDHPLADKPLLTPQELASQQLIGSPTAPRFERWREQRGSDTLGEPFIPSLLCSNFEVLVRLAEVSDAVVFGPRELLAHYENTGRVKIMPWPLDGPEMQTCLIRSRGRPLSPAASTLADEFLQWANKSE